MNELDMQLESELRRFLDPISAAPVPPRRARRSHEVPTVELRVVTPKNLVAIPLEVFS